MVSSLHLFVAVACVQLAVGCRPGPGWYPATPNEQAANAAIVVSGRVTAETWNAGSTTATLAVSTYHCGCGPEELTITGLRDGAQCGAGVPGVGKKYTFFLCKDEMGGELSVNSFTLHTGMLEVSDEVTSAVTEECGAGKAASECSGDVVSHGRVCKDRQTEPVVAHPTLTEAGKSEAQHRRRRLMMSAKKVPKGQSKEDSVAEPNGSDKCLDARYACETYGKCCGHGNYKLPGHKDVCARAKKFSVGGNCAAIGTHEGEI